VDRPHPDLDSNAGPKRNITPSPCPKRSVRFLNCRGHTSARFIAGTALIAGSFLVYLAYPIVLFVLPFSRSIKLGAAVAIWIASWGVFSAGIFLAGPEGFERFKGLWLRIIGNHSWAKPDRQELSDE